MKLGHTLSAAAFLAVMSASTAFAACAEAPAETRSRGDTEAAAGILALADEQFGRGEFAEACVKYRLVLGLDRGNEAARLGLGEGALAQAEYQAARAHFEDVARRLPESSRAHQGIGLSYLLAGDMARSEPALRQSVALDASLWRSWNGLAVIADARGDWAAADEAFARAIDAAPREAIIYNNLGLSRLQRGAHASAIEAFDRALQLRPAMRTAVENRRIALAMSGEYDAALAGVSEAELPAALNNVAVIAARRGDRAIADRLFAAALTASPRYYELAARNRDAATSFR